jgi:hypothetical protein
MWYLKHIYVTGCGVCRLLQCDTVQSGACLPTRHRNLLPPLEWSINPSSKKSAAPRDFFSSTNPPESLWGPNNVLFNSNWDSFPGKKRPGRDVDYLSPSSAEVKNEWIFNSFSPVCLHCAERYKFTYHDEGGTRFL